MKIISYSLFGEELFYRKGLSRNIDIAAELFDGWVVRVYASKNIPSEYLKSISKSNVDLRVVQEEYYHHGLLWRMLPLSEHHEVVIVRDCDTRLFPRDRELVDDWLSTSFKYHICRDHPGHRWQIMAGLWGGRKSQLPIQVLWDSWRKKQKGGQLHLWDQGFLKEMIYPRIRSESLIYSDHVVYEGEKNISRIPGLRGNYDGREIVLGMYCSEDYVDSDDALSETHVLAKGSSKNATRRDIFEMDLESSSNVLKIYKSKRQYSSVVINLIYLTLDIILKIIDNKNSKILQWLGVYIKFKVVTGLRLKRIKAKHPDLFYM